MIRDSGNAGLAKSASGQPLSTRLATSSLGMTRRLGGRRWHTVHQTPMTMKRAIRIGIVADYDPKNKYHVATEQSVAHAAEALGVTAESRWLDTDTLDNTAAEARLAECDAIWCGTSSPYRSMEGALRAIRFARERGWPFIGT